MLEQQKQKKTSSDLKMEIFRRVEVVVAAKEDFIIQKLNGVGAYSVRFSAIASRFFFQRVPGKTRLL